MAKDGKASRHIELERKFAVPESGVLPSFEGMSGVVVRVEQQPTQHLEATYFDTERHGLAANRITLRRRSGGSDAGWHLKLPSAVGAGAEARTEVRAPLGPDLPAELRDMVLAIVRDRPLQPVARISTARDVTLVYGPDGHPLAEFCDDRVTAWRLTDDDTANEQQWREWELELVDAQVEDAATLLDRLTGRLLDAGAAPAGHASKLAKVLGAVAPEAPSSPEDPVHRAVAEQVAELLEWDRAVRADGDDAVHQMRVTIRQIRSLLQASEEEFGLTDDATILSELRELAAVLGIARDAEVLTERYRDALDALPPEMVRGPVRARLVDGGWQRYKAGLSRSVKAMRSPRYFRLLDALDAVVVSGPPPGEDHPHATIGSGYRRVRKRARAMAEATTEHDLDDALHGVRKAAKRLRYVAAATGETEVSAQAKVIQSLLGDHQDSVVSRSHLLAEADVAHAAGEDTFTYGVLFQQEEELSQRCREQLDGALKSLRRSVRKAR
ncbi:MAG: CYTH and CHAD domain-containing protein [Mycobacteriaceae bacterium]